MFFLVLNFHDDDNDYQARMGKESLLIIKKKRFHDVTFNPSTKNEEKEEEKDGHVCRWSLSTKFSYVRIGSEYVPSAHHVKQGILR